MPMLPDLALRFFLANPFTVFRFVVSGELMSALTTGGSLTGVYCCLWSAVGLVPRKFWV